MSSERFDIIVVGGGPGGSSVAAFLAQRGYSVLLLEKEHFPRFHIGESLIPGAWDLWDKLGIIPKLETAGFPVKQGVNFAMFRAPKDVALLTAEYPEYFPRPYAYHVERARFDQLLLNNARRHGAQVREGWTVKDVLFEGGQVIGVLAAPEGGAIRSLLAPITVDATGRRCLLAGKLGWHRPDPTLNKVSYFTHFEGAYRRLNPDSSCMTDIHTIDGGWLWYIPLAHDLVSVGIVVDHQSETIRTQKGLQARFDHGVNACPRIREWIGFSRQIMEVHAISNISYQNHCFVGDGFVMIGDAAIFVDPIFSAGVTLAMRGAMFAADAIHEAFRVGDFRAEQLAPYENKIRYPMKNIFQMIYNWYRILDSKDPHNVFYLSQEIPLLRERLIVLLSGGYERVDMDALLAAEKEAAEARAVG